MRIVNINENYGESLIFEGGTLDDCIGYFAQALVACNVSKLSVDDTIDILTEGVDYEILD